MFTLHHLEVTDLIIFKSAGNMVLSSGQFEVYDNDTSKSEMTAT